MAETTIELPQWKPCEVEAATPDGPVKVPAITHELIPGLAVTMVGFGTFGVTHLRTGKRPVPCGFERAGSACHLAAQIAAVAKLAGVTWDTDAPDLDAMLACEAEVPFDATVTDKDGTRKQRCGSWLRTWYQVGWLRGDEFPWESEAESPWGLADKVLRFLAAPQGPEVSRG